MPTVNALSIAAMAGIGTGGAGYLAHRHVSKRGDLDASDKLGIATMSALTGGGIAAAAGLAGRKNLYGAAKAGYKGMGMMKKALMFNPVGKMVGRKGTFGSIPKVARGPLGLLAMAALAVGATAYGANSNSTTTSYATSDGMGGSDYRDQPSQSTRERAGMMGATGDLVFGLNNMRHG